MSHAALIQVWKEEQFYGWSGAPPSLEMLLEEATISIQDAEDAIRNLEPPSMIGYGLYVDVNLTIGDMIDTQRWRIACWTLALAAPDSRPPLFACLLDLALGRRAWLGDQPRWPSVVDDELRFALRCWDGHTSVMGDFVARLWRAKRRKGYDGARSSFVELERDDAVVAWWREQANDKERECAWYLLKELGEAARP